MICRQSWLIASLLLLWVTGPVCAAKERIVIAIIDDAFNVEHEVFNGMRWRNPRELANNQSDDDNNGLVDDIVGWDVADQDGGVAPPQKRAQAYAHGTFMAGIIAQEIRRHLGQRDDYPIKLMFVKAISDHTNETAIKLGYQGLQYAVDAQADVINLSWSGGDATPTASKSLQRAQNANTFVVASLGNHPQPSASFPAAHDAVFGVSGVSASGMYLVGNYGEEADLAADASEASSADVTDNQSFRKDAGVSIATAKVSAAVALMKLANEQASNTQIKACLQMTAKPVDDINADLPGQFGAGSLNTQAAIDCISSPFEQRFFKQPEGIFTYSNTRRSKALTWQWTIAPEGEYNGLVLRPFVSGDIRDLTLKFAAIDQPETVLWQGPVDALPTEIRLRQHRVVVTLSAKQPRKFTFSSHYKTNLRDLSKEFCRGRIVIDKAGIIQDGSRARKYANRSDCEWLIKAPTGHHIVINFDQVDTQLHTDFVYLFHGETREQRNLLMRLSGKEMPPKILIKRQSALLWFVSNQSTQGQGFSARIDFEPNTP